MTKKEENIFQPKSLTTEQRLLVDQLVVHFGEKHTNVKFSDLKTATKEILHIAFPPGWITRNKKVRNKEKRGRYDLSKLLKLPVVAFKESEKKKKTKILKKPPSMKTVVVEDNLDDLDGIPLIPPTE